MSRDKSSRRIFKERCAFLFFRFRQNFQKIADLFSNFQSIANHKRKPSSRSSISSIADNNLRRVAQCLLSPIRNPMPTCRGGARRQRPALASTLWYPLWYQADEGRRSPGHPDEVPCPPYVAPSSYRVAHRR